MTKYLLPLLLALAAPVLAQAPVEPPPEAPPLTRTFGGCNRPGTFCAGPSLLLPLSGYNLTTKMVVANFTPGAGYGFTIYPKVWYAFGLDVFVQLKPAIASDPQVVGVTVMLKFANYVRVGASRQIIGDSKSWVLPVGLGLDIP